MQRFSLIIITFLVVVMAAGSALALDGNSRKGKFLYRKNCRSCHGVSASDLSPSSKVQADWLKIYGAQATVSCHGDWPAMSKQDVDDIFAYLHEFGADSPTPAKCE